MPNALSLQGICKSFDGLAALTDAHFSADWGEVHALLGENGAGKSSLMNIAAGLYAPEAGELRVDDRPVRLDGPRDAARQRIGMVHQHFKLVQPFTVAQNIALTAPALAGEGSHRQRLARISRDLTAQAHALGFDIDPGQRVETLSIAGQQRVEILKVLLAGARILILDEPTAVLTDAEAERLLETLRGLAREGAAVVLVTHKLADVRRHADRVTVMRGGRTVATRGARQTSTAELVRLTVGDAPTPALPPGGGKASGERRLRIRGLRLGAWSAGAEGLNLDLHAGRIYGLAGVGGNGQSELADAIMGLPHAGDGFSDAAASGMTLTSGTDEGHRELRDLPTWQRRTLAIAAIPADRYGLALAGALSVAENHAIGAAHTGRHGPWWRLNRRQIATDAESAVREFDIQGVRSVAQKAALLSGGNAQKLVLAREFGRQPTLVLAHSPSRGLDVRASADVHARLRLARHAGAAVLLISEDLDEILALSDRIGVMALGRIVAEFTPPADRQAIGAAMVAHG